MTDTVPIADSITMLAQMSPIMLDDHAWQFAAEEGAHDLNAAFAIIREREATTLVIPADGSDEAATFARITLQVHSALEGVGLTAAVSAVLAKAGIACNVVAGLHHDHLFVPWLRRQEALTLLEKLSLDARR